MGALFTLLVLLCQDAPPQVLPVEGPQGKWKLAGAAEVENETELSIRARRVVRKWEPASKAFRERLSDISILRTSAVVANKRYDGAMRAGTPGRYDINVSNDDKLLYTERLAMGAFEPLYVRGLEDLKTIQEIVDKSYGFLDEIEGILSRKIDNSDKHRQDYLKRVGLVVVKVEDLMVNSDFTGTADVLKGVLFHILNVQIWEEKNLPPAGQNDPPRLKKKVFVDMDMTIEMLRKTLESVPLIISSEIKVSTCLVLERLFVQAGDNERRKDVARAVARAASKLAEAAPVADRELVGILDQAADRATDTAEIRPQLQKTGTSLVLP